MLSPAVRGGQKGDKCPFWRWETETASWKTTQILNSCNGEGEFCLSLVDIKGSYPRVQPLGHRVWINPKEVFLNVEVPNALMVCAQGEELPVTSAVLAITGTRSQDWRAWWHDVFLQLVSWVPSPRAGVQCFFPFPKPSLITELHVACLYCGPPCFYFLWALTVRSLEI